MSLGGSWSIRLYVHVWLAKVAIVSFRPHCHHGRLNAVVLVLAVIVDGHVVDVICFRHAFPNVAFFDGRPLACIIEPVDCTIHGKLAQYASEVVGEFPELASRGVVDIDCCV